jgi:hypothetical protein
MTACLTLRKGEDLLGAKLSRRIALVTSLGTWRSGAVRATSWQPVKLASEDLGDIIENVARAPTR